MIILDQNIPDTSLISYYNLTDKPFINGVMIDGSLSLNDLGITSKNEFENYKSLLQTELSSLQGSKQSKLISGENIKTVNGQSILGNGNLSIEVPVTSVNGMIGDVVIDVPSLIPSNYITYDKMYAEDYISKSVARDFIRWEFEEQSNSFVRKNDVDTSLNNESINPVQNKVITDEFTEVRNEISITENNLSQQINRTENTLSSQITSIDNSLKELKGDGEESIGELEARIQAIEDGSQELQNYIKKGNSTMTSVPQITVIQTLTMDEYIALETVDASTLYVIK